MAKLTPKRAEKLQEKIFDRMPLKQRVKSVSDLSTFILQLNKLGDDYRFPKTYHKNRKDIKRL